MGLPSTVPYLNIAWDDIVFVALASVLLGGALMVVLNRNIIRSGLWMILSFAALAGFYVLLGAPLVAGAQVLVYIGAIAVLILFAIMLTQSKSGPARLVFHHQSWAAAILAIFLVIIFAVVIVATAWPSVAGPVVAGSQQIAHLLFNQYVLAFEVISVLLLAAVIGGIFLAKRDDAETDASQVDLTNPPAIPSLPARPELIMPGSTPSTAGGGSMASSATTTPAEQP